MNREDFETLGDLHKKYEARTETYLLPGCPVVVRLDGRSFSKYTKGLERPYDARMSLAMIETTKFLLGETHASIGYCQSDEITLGFRNENEESYIMFSGRVQKICSIFASLASVKFNRLVGETIPEKSQLFPVFDARVFQYPTLELACYSFLWRETDATRNSLTMLAHSFYTPKELHKAGFQKKHDLLHAKGVNWNDYPDFFKRGTYVGSRVQMKELSVDELKNIPEKHRPTGPIARNVIIDLKLPPYTQIVDPVSVFFVDKV